MNSFGVLSAVLAQAADAAVQTIEAAEAAPAAKEGADSAFGWLALLGLLAIVFVPFLLGQLIERALKLRDIAFRLGLLLFLLTVSITPFVWQWYHTGSIGGAIPLGIDLAGGTNLVYQVDREKADQLGKRIDSEAMDKLRAGVSRRVDPAGTEEMTVRVVGDDRIEVIVPGADAEKTQRIKDAIVNLGSLEFSIVVNNRRHPDLYQQGLEQLGTPDVKEIRDSNGVLRARWVPVAFDPEGQPKMTAVGNGELMRPATVRGKPGYEILVLNEPNEARRITGRYLVNAAEQFQATGSVVSFTLNQEGGYLFQNLTYEYRPEEGDPHRNKLAILLSDEVHSAPELQDVIGTTGQISGRFSPAEIQELVNVLNAGALEVPLTRNPVTEFTVSPLLGADVQRAGLRSMVVSAIAVFAVVVAYYWLAGVVADICLLCNIILAAGVLSLIDATFTLPGLAGFVLSIAMAVDSNVLIFERIREEQARGASLRMAINNGFNKALSAIIDSNLTSLITAVVLYVIGTDQVKGFAVTLFIGIVVSMYTALTVGRLIFDILERKRWITSLPMAKAIGITDVDFLRWGKPALIASVAAILLGLGAMGSRGQDNFDIDFSGGTMVTFQFVDPQPSIQQAQERLVARMGDSISVEELTVGADPASAERLIRLRTTDDNPEEVTAQINDAFNGSEFTLLRQSVNVGDVAPVAEVVQTSATQGNGDLPFAGGHEAKIEVSQPIFAASLEETLAPILTEINKTRYDNAADLLSVTSEEGPSGEKTTRFIVRGKADVRQEDFSTALTTLKTNLERDPFFTEKNTFDSAVGNDMKFTAILAMIFSLGAMMLYLWFRFQGMMFGLAATVALAVDVLITLGCIGVASLLRGNPISDVLGFVDFKINLSMVASLLTVAGYSLNDKIVIFDRIREVRGKSPLLTRDMVNLSINQTLSRTLLTSTTTLIVILILYYMGGEGIHGFAFCLFVGIVVGTFSSIYIASPVLLWLMNRPAAAPARA